MLTRQDFSAQVMKSLFLIAGQRDDNVHLGGNTLKTLIRGGYLWRKVWWWIQTGIDAEAQEGSGEDLSGLTAVFSIGNLPKCQWIK
jgi:hypothetical protein